MLYPLDHIVLASASPARQHILKECLIPFHTFPTAVDESLYTDPSGKKQAAMRAHAKLDFALKHYQTSALIIAADQTLMFDEHIFDKAQDSKEAKKRLESLQGNSHQLYSAVALGFTHKNTTEHITQFTTTTTLTMKAMSCEDIDQYLSTGEWQGSVGCYRIEGAGKELFSYVSSDAHTIAGLPIKQLKETLLEKTSISLNTPINFPLMMPSSQQKTETSL